VAIRDADRLLAAIRAVHAEIRAAVGDATEQ
jgi:hypothetical protein